MQQPNLFLDLAYTPTPKRKAATEDVCARKHGGNAQSIEANKKVDKLRDRERVIEFLKANGKGYSKQIARFLNKPLNSISGRFSDLLRDGVIERIEGETSEGCAVLRLKD